MKRPLLVALVAVAAAASILLWSRRDAGDRRPATDGRAGTAANGSAPLCKVLFIGIDGADWQILDPLIAAGRLPHLEALVREGAAGELRSLEPMLSPLLWTTMATGKLPEEHGILSFTAYDPQSGKRVPISRSARKVDAFWNMLSDQGRSVDIVGWLATYPAEGIHGVMVTDRVGYLAYAGGGQADEIEPGTVSPEARSAEVAQQLVRAAGVEYGDFRRFMAIDEPTFLDARSRAFDPKNPINNMIMLYASTVSYRNIARHLLEKDRPDFLGVYFELPDATSHLFMHYAPPRSPGVDAAKFERFRNTVEEAYVLQDEIIGDLVDRAGDDTVIMLASDHGFRSGATRPNLSPEIWEGKAAFWHRLEGVVVLSGKGIRKGHRIEGATLLDVAPTILALQGLPKPTDMPGRVLVEALDDALAARLNTTAVATLQRQRQAAADSPDERSAREALKKLEALGYITPENPDAFNNLGQRYQQQGQYAKAIAEFKKAIAVRPDFPAALNNLGVCHLELQQYPEAEAAFRKALALKADDVYAMNNLAVLFAKRGDLEAALGFAEQAVKVEPNYARGHLTLGSIYGSMNSFDKAAREFRKVLEIDPTSAQAKEHLEQLRSAGHI